MSRKKSKRGSRKVSRRKVSGRKVLGGPKRYRGPPTDDSGGPKRYRGPPTDDLGGPKRYHGPPTDELAAFAWSSGDYITLGFIIADQQLRRFNPSNLAAISVPDSSHWKLKRYHWSTNGTDVNEFNSEGIKDALVTALTTEETPVYILMYDNVTVNSGRAPLSERMQRYVKPSNKASVALASGIEGLSGVTFRRKQNILYVTKWINVQNQNRFKGNTLHYPFYTSMGKEYLNVSKATNVTTDLEVKDIPKASFNQQSAKQRTFGSSSSPSLMDENAMLREEIRRLKAQQGPPQHVHVGNSTGSSQQAFHNTDMFALSQMADIQRNMALIDSLEATDSGIAADSAVTVGDMDPTFVADAGVGDAMAINECDISCDAPECGDCGGCCDCCG